MLPIVQRSLPLAHQFDFATPPDAGYGEFGARDSQACFGTKRTCQLRSAMFAYGNKVDIDRAMQNVPGTSRPARSESGPLSDCSRVSGIGHR